MSQKALLHVDMRADQIGEAAVSISGMPSLFGHLFSPLIDFLSRRPFSKLEYLA